MILALETSTRRASLAVYDRAAGETVGTAVFVTDRAHNAAIFEPLGRLVEAHRDSLEGFVVGLGPGSYGGVRVGLAAANGLAVALGLPVAGGSSLEAWDTEDVSYVVVGDARRGTWSLALVRDRVLQGEPELLSEGEVQARLDSFRDEGLSVHSPDAKIVERLPGAVLSYPDAARLAARFRKADLSTLGELPLEPHYLRAPYITEPKRRSGE